MLTVALGHSEELDSQDAIQDVLDQCNKTLGGILPQAGLLYVGIDHDYQLILDRINEVYPEIELIGCTTDGEMSSVHGFAEDSIVQTLFYSEELHFKAGVADKLSEGSHENIKIAVEAAKSSLDQEPVLCITAPSPLNVNYDVLFEGLHQALGDTFPIFGGLAGDQWRFQGTYQFYNRTVFKDSTPFLLISGPILYSIGVESGWMPIGKKGKVTQSENNVVYKIGDQSALEYYKYYLGEDILTADMLPIGDYPLAVFEDDDESFYLRAVASVDKEKGSIALATNIPVGATVQITHTTRDKIVEAAIKSVDAAITGYPGTKPSIAICFTCAARKQVLGTRVQEEYQVLNNHFPELPIAGFYSYGEIGPVIRNKPARLHQETFLSLLLGLE